MLTRRLQWDHRVSLFFILALISLGLTPAKTEMDHRAGRRKPSHYR